MKINYKFFALAFLLVGCSGKKEKTAEILFHTNGRVEVVSDSKVYLLGSASSIEFSYKGKNCEFDIESIDTWKHHNYYVLEVDGTYKGRFKIDSIDVQRVNIEENKDTIHHVRVFKATEAANGKVLFDGSKITNLVPFSVKPKKKIEFVGNSITCGMGNDLSIPCHSTDFWFDQHNAYWAYGPILARKLDADFLLSSVSGYGMYRNWNDEHESEPNLPDVYENLNLDKDTSKVFNTDFQPDLVSICLGTNDLSDGDGQKERLPFNKEKYIGNYIKFIKTIYRRYPNTRVVLLNSPMVSGEKNDVFMACLRKIREAFETDTTHKPITIFEYEPMTPKGCDYHPDIEDHKIMAQQLESTFKKLLNE